MVVDTNEIANRWVNTNGIASRGVFRRLSPPSREFFIARSISCAPSIKSVYGPIRKYSRGDACHRRFDVLVATEP